MKCSSTSFSQRIYKMNIDIGTLAYLQKENTQLKDEVEILQTELAKTKQELSQALDNEQLKLALETLNNIVGVIVKSGYIKTTEKKGGNNE